MSGLGKLEYREQHTGKYEDVYKNVEELKNSDVEKDVDVTRTRFNSL
ncbi:hypothetical protein MSIBF_A2190012 [groundwater metagenome]|uniref:Uncharacterized protein n=1 Tax=groundwater metagenome TaxID=717931 RepID=A0A098EA16_9ZZZZ